MAEIERTRVRERGPLQENNYERLLRNREEFAKRQRTGPVVVKPSQREMQITRQGRLMYLLQPQTYKDVPLQEWVVFTQDIRTHSGKHRHQGGIVIYVLEGKGYSIVDDERIDWEKGDLVLLPIKKGGVEHQHFNGQPGQPCQWVAFLHLPIMDYLSMEMVQMEDSPDFGKS